MGPRTLPRPALRVLVGCLVAACALAGCAGEDASRGPPLDDRGEFPVDLPAPAPTEGGDSPGPVRPSEPGGAFLLHGRVTDLDGRPLGGAVLWLAPVDLQEPVHNLDAYVEGRLATLQHARVDGTFSFQGEGGFHHVVARADGHLPVRVAPQLGQDGTAELDIRLAPDRGPFVVAHRGASFYAPENTLVAIEKALLLGARHVEVDVRLTADDALVLHHDHSLNRTTDGTGQVRDQTLEALRRLDAGGWFAPSFRGQQVPTLEEALRVLAPAGAHVVLDLKARTTSSGIETLRKTLEVVARERMQERALAVSGDRGVVEECGRQTQVRCGWILRADAVRDALPDEARSMGVDILVMQKEGATRSFVDAAHARGLRVQAWTPNDEGAWQDALDAGVDGLGTDRPAMALEYLREARDA